MKQTKAAELAGYTAPGSEAVRLMQHPRIRSAVHAERERLFTGDLGSLAITTLRGLMESNDTPSHVRFQAAKFTLQVAGHYEKTGSTIGLNGPDKPLAEMTEAELAAFIERGKKEVQVFEMAPSTSEAQERASRADGGE